MLCYRTDWEHACDIQDAVQMQAHCRHSHSVPLMGNSLMSVSRIAFSTDEVFPRLLKIRACPGPCMSIIHCLPTIIICDPHAVHHTAHISTCISPGWHHSSRNWMRFCMDEFTTWYFMLCCKIVHTIYAPSWLCHSTQPVSLMGQADSYAISTDTALLWKSFSCMGLEIKYTYQLYTYCPVSTHLWQLAYPANNATLRQTTPTAQPHNSFSNQNWRPKKPSIHSCI